MYLGFRKHKGLGVAPVVRLPSPALHAARFVDDMFAAFTVTASAVRAPCAMHSRTAQPHQSARIAAFSTGAGRRELALSTARRQGPSRHGVAARKIEATAHRANVQATATEVGDAANYAAYGSMARSARERRERAPDGGVDSRG